jgi:hypothetical protein
MREKLKTNRSGGPMCLPGEKRAHTRVRPYDCVYASARE